LNRSGGIFGNLDPWLVFFYFFLVFFGWANIYSSSSTEESREIFNMSTSHGKQLLWMGICFGLAFFIMLFDSRFYTNFWYIFYGGTILMLVLVLVVGQTVDGNKSWFVITSTIKIQPSEFAKFATALALGKIMSLPNFSFKPNNNNRPILSFRGIPIINTTKLAVLADFAVVLPMVLILLENDTGSALVFTAFILAMFRFGLPWILLILAASFILLFFLNILFPLVYILVTIGIIVVIVYFLTRSIKLSVLLLVLFVGFSVAVKPIYNDLLKPHHRTRIMVLLGKEKDRKGAAWNVYNSKVAIGSGGFLGKGYLHGSFTKLKFIPKQRTDFIFSTVGEEWGFWGSSLVLIIYLAFLIRLLIAADRQRNRFHMVYGYCVACLMFFHFYMNIGTTIGLAPAVGVPLPFFSYGGSSLLGFTILMWVFIKMDSQNMQILR
jgi:rod shape determining protein RodA